MGGEWLRLRPLHLLVGNIIVGSIASRERDLEWRQDLGRMDPEIIC